MDRRRAAAVGTLVLVVTATLLGPGIGAGVAVTADSSTTVPTQSADHQQPPARPQNHSFDGPRITIIATPATDADGPLSYEVRVSNLEDVDTLWVLTAGARTTDIHGATHAGESQSRLRWTQNTSTVQVALVPTGDPSADGTLRVAGDGWAFGPVPPLVVAWLPEAGDEMRQLRPFENREAARVSVRTPDGGVVGQKFALAGSATVRTTDSASGPTRVVVPTTVSPRAETAETLDALASAAGALDDGAPAGDRVIFVLPNTVRPGGATFLSADETWINAETPLHSTNNVWFHEYVHTRQTFDLSPRMAWFEEASAEYYAARLATDLGYSSPADRELYWAERTQSTATLTTPATWDSPAVPYQRGALALAALDEEIRTRSDGTRSLEDVFRRMNQYDGVVTYDVFVAIVSDVAGEGMRPWLNRHVAGSDPIQGPAASTALVALVQTGLSAQAASPLGVIATLGVLGGIVTRTRPFR